MIEVKFQKWSVMIFVVLLSHCVGVETVKPVLIREFDVPSPAFTTLYPYKNGSGTDLLISNFGANPLIPDKVYIVDHVEKYVTDHTLPVTPSILTDTIVWPNELSGIPENIFNKRLVVVPGGFLVPLKTKGALTFVDPALPSPDNAVVITEEGQNWFYHRVEWRDMDQDGDLDVLTCRADKPIFGSEKGELVWFENAGPLNQTTPWRSHVIAQGPDIFFHETRMSVNESGNSLSAIFIAQFFQPALRVFWVENAGNWADVPQIKHRDIDTSIGAVFDVKVCDVNGNGRQDLLVTTNNAKNGSLLVYEIPDDFRTGVYRRHLLASGFKSSTGGIGKGAPGAATLVRLSNRAANASKPFIVLSGDDEGKAFIVAPRSEVKDNWTYEVTSFLDAGSGTVGEIAIADVDQDGRQEMFVPAYSKSKMYIFRLE